MQAVRNKLATLKAKLDEADRNAKAAEDELQDCNNQADEAEEKVLNISYINIFSNICRIKSNSVSRDLNLFRIV